MNKRKRILVAPLDWGLGHASRCIPLIDQLLKRNMEVLIAADGAALKLLQYRFPELDSIRFEGSSITYSSRLPLTLSIAMQAPNLLRSIRKEHKELDNFIDRYSIDGLISDNRYGLYSSRIPSVFITHQLFVQASVFSKLLRSVTKHYTSKYLKCWVPDYKGEENLSGALSHGKHLGENIKFIGPLSRFDGGEKRTNYKRRLMVILSGPEPSRSMLEAHLLKQLSSLNEKVLFVRGKPEEGLAEEDIDDNIHLVSHLPSGLMQEEMENSELIICRSGYSSIMDMAAFGKQALLIPTKGQTEQEYLARYHMHKKNYYAVEEDQLKLKQDIEKALQFKGISSIKSSKELEEELDLFLNHC